jgi:hypothetical protein
MLGVPPFGLTQSSRLAQARLRPHHHRARRWSSSARSSRLIAAAVRLDSKGPVFFRQVRVGRDGRHFAIFKFRSMVVDADEQKERLREFNEVGDGMFKLSSDPRVTRVGRVLRRTSLDELPAAVQRHARRDEPSRPAPARDRRGRVGCSGSIAAASTSLLA